MKRQFHYTILIIMSVLLTVSCAKVPDRPEVSWTDYNSAEAFYYHFNHNLSERMVHDRDTIKLYGWLGPNESAQEALWYLVSDRDLQSGFSSLKEISAYPHVVLADENGLGFNSSLLPDSACDALVYITGVICNDYPEISFFYVKPITVSHDKI